MIICLQGDCEWAKWLLFSRVKGCEYEASFSNARSNLSCKWSTDSNLYFLSNDEMIPTIDYMAKEEGATAALATLMYAASPIQKCLCSGSVSGNASSSFQCTLENLRSGLQKYPTLWRTLVSSCFGRDAYGSLISNANNGKLLTFFFNEFIGFYCFVLVRPFLGNIIST